MLLAMGSRRGGLGSRLERLVSREKAVRVPDCELRSVGVVQTDSRSTPLLLLPLHRLQLPLTVLDSRVSVRQSQIMGDRIREVLSYLQS